MKYQSKPRCGAWQYVHQFLFLTREEVPRLTVTWTRELERRQKPGRWSPGGWRSCGERAKVLSTFTFRPAVLFNLFTFTFHPAVFFICVFPVVTTVLEKDSYGLKVLAEIKFKCRGAFACSKDKNRNHHEKKTIVGPKHKCRGGYYLRSYWLMTSHHW